MPRAIFDRYHIVAPSDLRDAARKLEVNQQKERAALKKSRASEFGAEFGHGCTKTAANPQNLCVKPVFAHCLVS